jgi:poly(beta-D-mannuronate) lyase
MLMKSSAQIKSYTSAASTASVLCVFGAVAMLVLLFPAAVRCMEALNGKTLVSTNAELKAAIRSAVPGSRIILHDGIWHDAAIDFNSTATAAAPVILQAQTPGGAIFDGTSMLTFSKPHLIVDGVFFRNGALKNGAVITFNSDSCRLTNSAVVDYNPEEFETRYYWVYFHGNHNRVDHCFFKGKSNLNPVVGNDNENSRYNSLDHNYFKDIPYVADANGREILRIWGYGHGDEMGDDGAFFTVEYNLFERAHGEGTEIISLKSNHNIVRYNTVRATRGGMTCRRGHYNTFEGNFILGDRQEGSSGIRVAGQYQRVVNNYISDVAEDGVRLISGEYVESALTERYKPFKEKGVAGRLPKYSQVVNSLFAHNTIVNAGGYGIDLGFGYKSQWPETQMVLLPSENMIVNNLVVRSSKGAVNTTVPDTAPPLGFLTFKPNNFGGNFFFGENETATISSPAIHRTDPLMVQDDDGIFRLTKKSPAMNSGIVTDVNTDMNGQSRDGTPDAGAEEFRGDTPRLRPLYADDVGPGWIIKRRRAGDQF